MSVRVWLDCYVPELFTWMGVGAVAFGAGYLLWRGAAAIVTAIGGVKL